MIATIINALTIILGSSIGLGLRGKIHDHYEDVIFTALGFFTLLLGFTMAQSDCNALHIDLFACSRRDPGNLVET